MKTHTSEFKEQIKTLGRELDSRVSFNNTELGGEQLNSVIPHYEGGLLKSVMKQLDIDSNVEINVGNVVNYKLGIKVNDEYEYLNFGDYIVNKVEKQEDFNSYMITCYDKMLYSMKDYEKLNISYPISIRDYITAICNHLGINFKNKNETFANYDKMIQNELYLDENDNSLGYTFRDVFDELAQATASTICINDNDELEIRYINDTQDTIDEEFLRDVNVNFGKKYGKVNSIVLSRSSGSDNVYLRDEASVSENGLTELKISDNQIMNWNDRSDYLPDILEKINGLEYYLNDFVSTGVCYYDLCDKYNVKIGDNIYPCIMLNDEINITQGLFEEVFTEELEISETDYTKSDKTDRKINQTYLIVDKQNGVIQGVVEKTEQIEQDITTTKQSNGYPITIEDAGVYPLDSIEIEGKNVQDGTPTPTAPIEIKSVEGVTNLLDTPYTEDNKLIMTATRNDHYTNSDYYAYLEAGKEYTFSCKTTGTYGNNNTYQTECFLLFEKAYNYIIHMDDKNGFIFKPKQTGKYYLRYDVNISGETHSFWDFQIEEGTIAHPFVSYGRWLEQKTIGKNKFNKNLFNEFTHGLQYIFLTLEPNTQYTFSTTMDEVKNIGDNIFFINNGEDASSSLNGVNINKSRTITTDSTGKVKIGYRDYNNLLTGEINNYEYQLEKGTTSTPYEPYKENTALIDLNKKNLANINDIQVGKQWNDMTNTTRASIIFIPVKPNTQYTLSGDISSNSNLTTLRIVETNSEKTSSYVKSAGTFTTFEQTSYVSIEILSSTTITSEMLKDIWVKLYEGVETDDYYRLASIGDVKDTFKDGVLSQRIGKVVLDGSESWDYSPTNGFNRFILSANEFIGKINSTPISTHFIGGRTDNKYNEIYLGGSGRLAILYNTTSSSEFKTWLSNNPVEVYYELATPIEHTLDYEILELHEGYNNITLNDDVKPNMNVVYLTDSTMNSTYATKSELKVESDAINLRVDGKIDDKDLTSAEIIARINKKTGTSEAKIKANSISLEGFTTVNDNFQIDEEGNMKAVDGTFEGHVTATSGSIGEWQIDKYGNLYADREVGGIVYRTYIQQANEEDGEDTWAFSTQISKDGGESFAGTSIIYNNGDIETTNHLIVTGDLQFANNRVIPVQYYSFNSGNIDVYSGENTGLGVMEFGPGRFIVVTQFSFSANANGMRRVNISTQDGSAEANIQQGASPTGVTRMRHTQFLNNTKNTDIYWNVYQNSGSELTCNATAWIYRIQ